MNEPIAPKKRSPLAGISELTKYSAVFAIVFLCMNALRKRLAHYSWSDIGDGLAMVSVSQILLAILITAANFIVLAGYDWIAITYLKKRLPASKLLVGAIVGYAFSNLLGWMLGGTSVRYRLYTRWGFSLVEVITFISVLSITFWLGMFLLAGVAFVILPVDFPNEYKDHLFFAPATYGYLFLTVVFIYLLASALMRRPVRIAGQSIEIPSLKLSALQLIVSAADFALATLVLYVLLPPGISSYSTVLVGYLSAMIVTVILHVPGGFGILDLIVLELLVKDQEHADTASLSITCGVLLFRVIYHLLPGAVAAGLFLREELAWLRRPSAVDPNRTESQT